MIVDDQANADGPDDATRFNSWLLSGLRAGRRALRAPGRRA